MSSTVKPQRGAPQVHQDDMHSVSSHSTQVIEEGSLPTNRTDLDIWGSLTPLDSGTSGIARAVFKRDRKRYVIGRTQSEAGSADAVDFSFPQVLSMSKRHCAIEWDGCEKHDELAIVVTDLGSRGGTWIHGQNIGEWKGRILRDWDIVSFGPPPSASLNNSNNVFLFRIHNMVSTDTQKRAYGDTYDVHVKLGKGAFGVVVKALHISEQRWYAIKLLAKGILSSADRAIAGVKCPKSAERQLKQEIVVLTVLRHPNIIQFKEVVEDDRGIGLVMEFMPGGDLGTYLSKHGVLGEPLAQNFTYQVCDALSYLHNEGVVHRDLKPANILLTDGALPTVKLADFGLAKIIDSNSFLDTHCGTRTYMAPEISSGTYNRLVDSWSMGVTVSMMLWNRTPFTNESDRSFSLDNSLLLSPGVSHMCRDFLSSLLALDPSRRRCPSSARGHPWLAAEARKRESPPFSSPVQSPRQACSAPPSFTLRTQRSQTAPTCLASVSRWQETLADRPSRGVKRTRANSEASSKLDSPLDAPPLKRTRADEDRSSSARVSCRASRVGSLSVPNRILSRGRARPTRSGWGRARYVVRSSRKIPGLGQHPSVSH